MFCSTQSEQKTLNLFQFHYTLAGANKTPVVVSLQCVAATLEQTQNKIKTTSNLTKIHICDIKSYI